MNNRYGSVIWTNHALERLSQRRMPQSIAYQAFRYPDRTQPGKNSGTTEYLKQLDGHHITVIAKPAEQGEWLILSCWVDPPYAGSIDIGKKEKWHKYQKASFWGKIWLTFLRQLGL